MNHEPECSVAVHANFFPELSSCSCDKLRAAYQRGRKAACEELSEPLENYAAIVHRVLEVHKPYRYSSDQIFCDHCWEADAEDFHKYPCPTIRALNGEQS
jgi:hypothetical protein